MLANVVLVGLLNRSVQPIVNSAFLSGVQQGYVGKLDVVAVADIVDDRTSRATDARFCWHGRHPFILAYCGIWLMSTVTLFATIVQLL
jgi:hypothetical protein